MGFLLLLAAFIGFLLGVVLMCVIYNARDDRETLVIQISEGSEEDVLP